MSNLLSVTLTSGIPTAGTGDVSTIDALLAVIPAARGANGGLKIEGVASGTVVPISVATLPALVAGSALIGAVNLKYGSTAADVGNGTIGSGTPRVALATDSAGIIDVGAAGTPSDQVLTIQGHSGMTAVKVDNSAVTQPISHAALTAFGAGEYETVAASATDQAIGATGASGDFLEGLLIVPATAAAGAVSIKDGGGSAISVFAGGGTTALPTLAPIYVPLGIFSGSGAWKVTTGANVSALAIGNFT